ncbi:UDP-forming cellulose synthase catalytic subunit [Methylobacterium sp. Leaf88]|uniref:UDP-forming cellulose synthase catalytic subunit n=1 Tax=Methylobacterium sp. Leaf88 TaxID=1736244 RepID=UPI0006FF7D5D|nr:UDP-forming cellulose synthase catalytic subunit [Methylobacterium sp. Leaf88]KQO77203.1 cellulose synthase [Methylobacterium sp. Leaf88]
MAWIASAAAVLVLLSQPVSTQDQLIMSLCAMAAMVVLWVFFDNQPARFVFLALGSLVVLRYMFWRVTNTLPSVGDPVSFGFGLLLLLGELYCVFILFVSLTINADPLRRAPPPMAAADDPEALDALPTVDIFVPSYNEDAGILSVTLAAARLIDYPAHKLTVWLLDDGGTDQKCADPDPAKAQAAMRRRMELQALAGSLGVEYRTRARNQHAKAGNLNNGLKHSQGEIIVVLDADHVPFRSFLRDTIGYFAQDPRLFLVQTPHAFLNPDPIERNLRTFERMPSENEMFYAVTQRGLDKWNGSFFCGSAALLRRRALDEAGGFSGVTITEDCETAFELHARGWNSIYVDKPLIAGLQPETLEAFIGQRSRWCQGMFQILLLKNPLFKGGLHAIQKVAYLSSMTFWFFPVPRLIFMFSPLLHIFFDLKIFVASVDESIAYTATYVVINLMMQNYVYGKFRWPFVSELYEYVQGLFLFRAIASVIVSPRRPTFNVTAKGTTLEQDHLSALAWPFFAVYGLLLLGCATALYRYLFEPGVTNLMLVVGLWNFFNLLMAGAALGVVAERRVTEASPSLAINRQGRMMLAGRALDVAVDRASAVGCTVRFGADVLPFGTGSTYRTGQLSVQPLDGAPAGGVLPFEVGTIAHAGDDVVVTLRFQPLDAQGYAGLANLMYGDAGALLRFQQSRRRHKNIVSGTLQLIWWGLVEPFRAFSYLFKPRPQAAPAPTTDTALPRTPQRAPLLPGGSPGGAEAARPRPAENPLPARPSFARSNDGEPGTDWVRLMLEFENDRLLGGAAGGGRGADLHARS